MTVQIYRFNCHTLRGCVDWNFRYGTKAVRMEVSHPSWVCGLKLSTSTCTNNGCRSHPSWVCGLKPKMVQETTGLKCHTLRGCVDWNPESELDKAYLYVTPFVGVWIETDEKKVIAFCELSHPSWVCGLKPFARLELAEKPSHTLRGCVDWNGLQMCKDRAKHSHTLRGCVDWNSIVNFIIYSVNRHTLRGCVDWNFIDGKLANRLIRHTLRGCVDWNYIGLFVLSCNLRHTLRGCVDWNYLYFQMLE